MTAPPNEIVKRIAGLIPAGDDRQMWRDHFALLMDTAADSDDLSLLRCGKQADGLEAGFLAFAAGFPGVGLVEPPGSGFYGVTLALAKLDRDARQVLLRAYAAELRK